MEFFDVGGGVRSVMGFSSHESEKWGSSPFGSGRSTAHKCYGKFLEQKGHICRVKKYRQLLLEQDCRQKTAQSRVNFDI